MPYKPVFDNLPNTPTFMDVVKAWNKETFGNALFAFPKKGYAPHQQIQDIRKGKEITPLTTVAEIKKEIPKKEKKPPSEKQKQARAKFSEMVKEKNKKTADKEKSVKEAIASIIKDEAVVIPEKEFKKEHEELVKVLKEGTDKEQEAEAEKQREEAKKQEAEPKKEVTRSKEMNPKLKSILEKIKKGRNLKSLFMDGKIKDESGAVLYEKGLNEFYDFMATQNGISDKKEAYGFLNDYMKWHDELFRKETKAKPEPKKEEIKKLTENVSKAIDVNPEEDWRAKAGYKDTEWKDRLPFGSSNRNSFLPQGYTKEDGYRWLESKYGDLYEEAIKKTKMLLEKSRSMTAKEAKEARRLEFKDGKQMKEFFRDVLLADPIIYNMININANSTKAPATTNGLREFKKWVVEKNLPKVQKDIMVSKMSVIDAVSNMSKEEKTKAQEMFKKNIHGNAEKKRLYQEVLMRLPLQSDGISYNPIFLLMVAQYSELPFPEFKEKVIEEARKLRSEIDEKEDDLNHKEWLKGK